MPRGRGSNMRWDQISAQGVGSPAESMRNAMYGISQVGTVFGDLRKSILDEEQRAVDAAFREKELAEKTRQFDITSTETARGHDLTYGAAVLGHGVTARGHNLAAITSDRRLEYDKANKKAEATLGVPDYSTSSTPAVFHPGNYTRNVESGGRSDAVNLNDNNRGISVGDFQLNEKAGSINAFADYASNINPNVSKLKGLQGKELADMWQTLVRNGDITPQMQQTFMTESHYKPAINAIQNPELQNMVAGSPNLQTAMFDMATQHGATGAANLANSVYQSGMNETQFLDAVGKKRGEQYGEHGRNRANKLSATLGEQQLQAQSQAPGSSNDPNFFNMPVGLTPAQQKHHLEMQDRVLQNEAGTAYTKTQNLLFSKASLDQGTADVQKLESQINSGTLTPTEVNEADAKIKEIEDKYPRSLMERQFRVYQKMREMYPNNRLISTKYEEYDNKMIERESRLAESRRAESLKWNTDRSTMSDSLRKDYSTFKSNLNSQSQREWPSIEAEIMSKYPILTQADIAEVMMMTPLTNDIIGKRKGISGGLLWLGGTPDAEGIKANLDARAARRQGEAAYYSGKTEEKYVPYSQRGKTPTTPTKGDIGDSTGDIKESILEDKKLLSQLKSMGVDTSKPENLIDIQNRAKKIASHLDPIGKSGRLAFATTPAGAMQTLLGNFDWTKSPVNLNDPMIMERAIKGHLEAQSRKKIQTQTNVTNRNSLINELVRKLQNKEITIEE